MNISLVPILLFIGMSWKIAYVEGTAYIALETKTSSLALRLATLMGLLISSIGFSIVYFVLLLKCMIGFGWLTFDLIIQFGYMVIFVPWIISAIGGTATAFGIARYTDYRIQSRTQSLVRIFTPGPANQDLQFEE